MKYLTLPILVFLYAPMHALCQTGLPDYSFAQKGVVKADLGAKINFASKGKQVLLLPDGGMFVVFESGLVTHVTKFKADGGKDSSYGQHSFSVPVAINNAIGALQADGKMLIAGKFFTGTEFYPQYLEGEDNRFDFGVARLNKNGSLDSTFSDDGIQTTDFDEHHDAITSIAVQKDGKIVVSGLVMIDENDNVERYIAIARYNVDGKLDTKFSNDGKQVSNYNSDFFSSTTVVQNDGKISVTGYGYNATLLFVRYNANGSVDNSFNLTYNLSNSAGLSFFPVTSTIQSDGKIITGGFFEDDYTNDNFVLVRFRSNGSRDSSFGNKGIQTTDFRGYNDYVKSLAVQSDGKILASGYSSDGGQNGFALARYTANGLLDKTFDSDGKKITNIGSGDAYAISAAIQSNGKYVLTGYAQSGENANLAIARYNTNGSLDNSFSRDGTSTDYFTQVEGSTVYTGIAIQSDRKIVASGYTWNGVNYDFVVARYNVNGSLDHSFSSDGIQTVDFGANEFTVAIAIQGDGKIVVAGNELTDYVKTGRLARLNSDGSIDITFNKNGMQKAGHEIASLALQTDGKIVIAGEQVLARYTVSGILDGALSGDGKQTVTFGRDYTYIRALAIQTDGKIIVAGGTGFLIARYASNGELDATFGNKGVQETNFFPGWIDDGGYAFPYAVATSVQIQNDGRIVVGGYAGFYQRYDEDWDIAVARYTADGNPDKTFSGDGMNIIKFNSLSIDCSLALKDSNIIVKGELYYNGGFDEFTQVIKFGAAFASLDADGNLDKSFGEAGKKYAEKGDQVQNIQVDRNAFFAAGFHPGAGKLGLLTKYLLEENKAPAVSITTPLANGVYSAGAGLTLVAAATDADGRISKVRFYNGGSLLYTDTTSPYTAVLTNLAAGNYSFVAKATDNNELTSLSASVAVTVSGKVNKAPLVKITSPASNKTYGAPASVTIVAAASDSDGTIAGVNFFSGGKLLKTDNTAPYSYTLTNVAAGYYSFVAIATDNNGAAGSSASVGVAVSAKANKAPEIKISSPGSNVLFGAPATITLNATATDADGTIASVQFYNGTTLLKTDDTSPYSYTLSNAAAGVYSFVAKATDNKGLSGSSASVAATVLVAANKAPLAYISSPTNNASYTAKVPVLIRAVAMDEDGTISKVQFYDGGSLLNTDSTPPFTYTLNNTTPGRYAIVSKATDNKGLSGSSESIAVLVSEPANRAPLVSIINPHNEESFTEPATVNVEASAQDPDGSISKVEFYKEALFGEPILLATVNKPPYIFKWQNLTEDTYFISAVATDNGGSKTSSALVKIFVVPNEPPTVSFIKPSIGQSFKAPATINFEVYASDSDGSISKVAFYLGGTLLKTELSPPYTFKWEKVPAGVYYIEAVATDDYGHTTSQYIEITVSGNNIEGKRSLAGGGKHADGYTSVKLFPNPAKALINIATPALFKNQQTTISVISASGVILQTKQLSNLPQMTQLNVAALSGGLYTLKIVSGGKVMYKKFVKL